MSKHYQVWKVAEHNGMWVDEEGEPHQSEELARLLRTVYTDDEGYMEFAVGAASAVPLAKLLNRLEDDSLRAFLYEVRLATHPEEVTPDER